MAQFSSDELKVLSVYAPVMLRMLDEREDRVLKRIYGEFRNGKKDFLTDIAEFAVIRDQRNEIKTALKQGE